MRVPALLATIILVTSVTIYAGITYSVKNKAVEEPKEEVVTEAPVEELIEQDIQEKPVTTSKPEYTKPEPIYITVPAQTQPNVEITNGVKNEGSGTVNVYNQPATTPTTQNINTTTTTQPEPPPPTPQTPLEKAQAIVLSFDPNGTTHYLSNNTKIKAYVFNGKEVVVDLVGDWETNLKVTLRKIK